MLWLCNVNLYDYYSPSMHTIAKIRRINMRSSGILLHITSLPSSMGVGTLAETDKFIKFLKAAKQEYWQILPITPTDFVNSPYASPSAFAGNTLLINVDELGKMGLVSEDTLADAKNCKGNDYGYAIWHKDIMIF